MSGNQRFAGVCRSTDDKTLVDKTGSLEMYQKRPEELTANHLDSVADYW
jgi:hypothetical protein